jgi:hypothetical protein
MISVSSISWPQLRRIEAKYYSRWTKTLPVFISRPQKFTRQTLHGAAGNVFDPPYPSGGARLKRPRLTRRRALWRVRALRRGYHAVERASAYSVPLRQRGRRAGSAGWGGWSKIEGSVAAPCLGVLTLASVRSARANDANRCIPARVMASASGMLA